MLALPCRFTNLQYFHYSFFAKGKCSAFFLVTLSVSQKGLHDLEVLCTAPLESLHAAPLEGLCAASLR